MRAEELMIGDLVRIGELNKYSGNVGKIKSLQSHKKDDGAYFLVFVSGDKGCVSTEVFNEDIEPIPLTPEILEKNGFEEDFYSIITANGFERLPEYKYKNMKEARDIRRNLIRVAYSNTEGGVYDIQAGIGSHIFSLKYVHELQHALRIMKIDKEIVI